MDRIISTRLALPLRDFTKIVAKLAVLILLLLPLASCEERVNPWDKFVDDPNVKLKHDKFGRVTSASTYNHKGELHGITERYGVLGDLSSRKNYVNGLEHGKALHFFQDGTIRVDIDFVDGLPHGRYISYYPGGAIRRTKDFVSGLAVGTSESYYPNGNVQSMEKFKQGKLHGQIDYFNTSGKIIRRATYIVGRLVRNEYPGSSGEFGSLAVQNLDKN